MSGHLIMKSKTETTRGRLNSKTLSMRLKITKRIGLRTRLSNLRTSYCWKSRWEMRSSSGLRP